MNAILPTPKRVEATDRVIEGLLMTMIHEGPRVIADPDNYEARANIMWAGMLAHNKLLRRRQRPGLGQPRYRT